MRAQNDEEIPIKICPDHIQNKYEKPKELHWLFARVYILNWIRYYDREKAVSDVIAGITLGLTIIPQSIAYAALAGVPSEYGLYSAFIGSIIYVFFGTIPQVSIGPTSLMSLLVFQYCYNKPVQFVIVLAFLAGLIEILMGSFQLGFIINFIPGTVTKAFTTGTAIIVASVQLKNLLGIKIRDLHKLLQFWKYLQIGDSIVGIICLIILLALKQLANIEFKENSSSKRKWKKFLWYISISRNFLVIFFCGLSVYKWVHVNTFDSIPFSLVSKVDSAIIHLRLPPFTFAYDNITYTFIDICKELGSAIFVVPIVAVLGNVAIAKAFAKDAKIDANQEMLTLGLCNIVGSLFSAIPTTGAFTRSAVSQASGIRTPMAGLYTGIIVLMALSILTPYFQYIPKSSLSAVLIVAVIFMIDMQPMRELWKSNKKDFVSWIGTLVICVIAGVEIGLLYGVILNLAFILFCLSSPQLSTTLQEHDDFIYIYIRSLSDIYYTGVEVLCTEIKSACLLYRYDFPVVVDCSRFVLFDNTFIDAINAIARELRENNVLLVLQSVPLKQQTMFSSNTNVRFCSSNITREDLLSEINNNYSKTEATV